MRDANMEYTPLEKLIAEDKVMLTTVDNPINPFVDFEGWMTEDMRLGYNTCQLVDRLYYGYADMSEFDKVLEYADVIRDLFKMDVTNRYTLAIKPDWME